MVLKPFNQVLNTDRPSRVSPGEASSWWRSDQRQTDHDNHVSSVCFLVAVQGRFHCALASAFSPAELEVHVSDEPAGPPSPSLSPSLPLSLSFSPSLHYSCLVHAWVWGDRALDSAIGLSSSLAKYGSSMGVRLRRNTSDMLTGDILTHFFSFTNSQANALNSKNEIS